MLLNRPVDLQGSWDQVLASHCLDQRMIDNIDEGRNYDFLSRRQQVLQSQLNSFLQRQCEWDFEDTPALDSLLLTDDEDADNTSADKDRQE